MGLQKSNDVCACGTCAGSCCSLASPTRSSPGMNGTLAKNLPQPLVAGLVVGAGTFLSILAVGLALGRLQVPNEDPKRLKFPGGHGSAGFSVGGS